MIYSSKLIKTPSYFIDALKSIFRKYPNLELANFNFLYSDSETGTCIDVIGEEHKNVIYEWGYTAYRKPTVEDFELFEILYPNYTCRQDGLNFIVKSKSCTAYDELGSLVCIQEESNDQVDFEDCSSIDNTLMQKLSLVYNEAQIEQFLEIYNNAVSLISESYKDIIDEICIRRKGCTPLIDLKEIKLSQIGNHGVYVIHEKYKIGLPMGQFEFTDDEWFAITDYIYCKNKGL
jgi:hypothetical protein